MFKHTANYHNISKLPKKYLPGRMIFSLYPLSIDSYIKVPGQVIFRLKALKFFLFVLSKIYPILRYV
jgi:hypothetical protein